MAKKTRKQKQRTATRRPGTPAPAAPSVATHQMAAPARVTEPDDEPAEDVIAAVESSTRRRVERVNPAAQPRPIRGQQSAAAMFLPLDSDDAAIPFDRVPYVPRDLRRVAIMASLMIVLILIAAFVVTRFNL